MSSNKYFFKQFIYILSIVITYLIILPINKSIEVNNYVMFFIKAFIEFVVINIIFLIMYCKTKDFKDIYERFIRKQIMKLKN